MADNAYYTLLTSLPHIDSLFNSKITPISRIQLDRRLAMLGTQEREILLKVEQLVHWSHLPDDVDEAHLITLAERLLQELKSPALKELVTFRLDMRTIAAAMRRKARGMQPPTEARWSYGSRYAYIRRNWSHPTLGLQNAFPWLPQAAEALQKKDHYALEKTVMEAVWNKLNELGAYHRFDFEAVVIYLVRWNLVARWTAYDGTRAVERFKQLTDIALGDFAHQLPA